jgi:hypothetical protein
MLFRTLYAATAAKLRRAIVLRSYKSGRPRLNPTIVEPICATIATPSYVSPKKEKKRKKGLHGSQEPSLEVACASIPARELLKEASTIFGKEKLVVHTVSLRCGHSHVYSLESSTDAERASRLVQGTVADYVVALRLSTRLCDTDT